MIVQITHWGIPGNGADLDAPYSVVLSATVNSPLFSELLFVDSC
jgi:hypothetical protein